MATPGSRIPTTMSSGTPQIMVRSYSR
jgi:hypothetical protein